jgi:hypothetical protein
MAEEKGPQKTVWEERWDALDAVLADMESWDVTGVPSFSTLVHCLRVFGKRHLGFFYGGFGFDGSGRTLQDSPKYPSEYALTVILDQVEYDLEVLRRIAEQRREGTSAMVSGLRDADAMASLALQSVVNSENHGLKGVPSTVITYFHKSPNVRVLPYAPTALVAIPFTCIGTPRDLLAIPHEVGHFVYWRGTDNAGKSLRAKLFEAIGEVSQDPVPYWYRWVEEIFADVYGCLIAGPVMALDFQDLQLQFSQRLFIKDDGAHPVPLLRPAIYTKVLNATGGASETLIQDLWGRWASGSRARLGDLLDGGEPGDHQLESEDGRQTFSMDDAVSPGGDFESCPVDWIVGLILDTPLNLRSLVPVWWSEYSQRVNGTDDLYREFEPQARGLSGSVKESSSLGPCDEETLWDAWSQAHGLPPSGEVRADIWEKVLRADGWTTKGPFEPTSPG